MVKHVIGKLWWLSQVVFRLACQVPFKVITSGRKVNRDARMSYWVDVVFSNWVWCCILTQHFPLMTLSLADGNTLIVQQWKQIKLSNQTSSCQVNHCWIILFRFLVVWISCITNKQWHIHLLFIYILSYSSFFFCSNWILLEIGEYPSSSPFWINGRVW